MIALDQLAMALTIGMVLGIATWPLIFGAFKMVDYYKTHDNLVTEMIRLALALALLTLALLWMATR
jgi:hypothetical protein